jgi:hypothetical protein
MKTTNRSMSKLFAVFYSYSEYSHKQNNQQSINLNVYY